jgi:cytochrome c
MDSFEWNKIIGAVLGTAIFIFVVRQAAEVIYEPEKPAKPGYVVEGVVESTASAAATPAVETMPDWGTVLPAADVAAGKTISGKCEQCHDLSKGGPNKIGPNLYGVVDRARASHPGFDYSSAMKAKGGNWTYDELRRHFQREGSHQPDRLSAQQCRCAGRHSRAGAQSCCCRRTGCRRREACGCCRARRRRGCRHPPCRRCPRSRAREKIRAQADKAEGPFPVAAGLGRPRQEQLCVRSFRCRQTRP